MGLTRLFLKRPTLAFVLIVITAMAGILAIRGLVVQQMPNAALPTITVSVAYYGASTTELRDEIAAPLEDALSGAPYLDHIDTTIQLGTVNIAAAFDINSSITEDIANVQKSIQQAQRQLPTAIQAPLLRVNDPSQPFVVTLALFSHKYSEPVLASIANNQIVPVLEQFPGVSNALVTGTTQAAYVVMADPTLLTANNLTLTDVINAIGPNNVRAPGGIVYQPGRETQLDVRGDITNVASIANLPIHVAYQPNTGASGVRGGGVTSATGTSAAPASGGTSGAATSSGASSSGAASTALVASSGASSSAAASAAPVASSGASSSAATSTAPAASISSAPALPTVPATTTAQTQAQPQTQTALTAQSPPTTARSPANGTSPQGYIVDQPGNVGAAANPNVASSEIGSGAGTSTSPFTGSLSPWAVPSADKRIGDVAQVTSGSVVQRVYSSLNGKPGISILVQKQASASEVAVANEVIVELAKLKQQFPQIDFQIEHVQATFTRQQISGVERTLLEGIILTGIVMLFFLRSWRNAIVVMIAIPTSLGVTLFAMWIMRLTLDTISLMAMTLIIGILIDDSVVVLENIERHKSNGEPIPDAALNGRSEIGLAAIVITSVDVIVFLPIAFAGGVIGRELAEFGIVVSVATLTSLFVSFTLTPTLAGHWALKSEWKPWRPIDWFTHRFEALRHRYADRWLPAAYRHPWPFIVASAVLCVAALALVPLRLIGEEFIPAPDQGIVYAQVVMAPGFPLESTRAIMSRLEAKVRQVVKRSDLQFEQTVAGAYSAPFGGFVQEGNIGQITMYLEENHKISSAEYIKRLQSALRPLVRNATLIVTQSAQVGGGFQQPIDELVTCTTGCDPAPYASRVYRALTSTPGTSGAQNSAANLAPQMEVDFDRLALQSMDAGIGTAANAVQAAFGGYEASQIETPDRGLAEIMVIYPRQAQTSLANVLNIPIRSNAGGIVHLGDVAHFRYAPAPLILTRENRQDVVHISSNVASGAQLSTVASDFLARVAKLHLPKFVQIHPAAQGQQALMNQALLTLGSSVVVSFVLVFLVIVALYNSYRTPFVTVFAIPLATIGAFFALWVTHQTLNLYSLIGMVLLIGLVTKNGILLVDYADIVRTRGKDRDTAMLEAASIRFRPILMTTVAMVTGMFPLALGLEPGGGSRASLAIAVIGGLISSLVLTLFVVPILYRWFASKDLAHELKFADEIRSERRRGDGNGKRRAIRGTTTAGEPAIDKK